MSKILTIAVYCLLFLCACSGNSQQNQQVKETVMRYEQVLAECYKNLNMNPLQQVATAEHAEKTYAHMAALGEGGVRLVSTLKAIEFKEISFPKPAAATVKTRETWDFAHLNIATGQKTLEKKDFPYEMAYVLQKHGDRWLVTSTSVQEAAGTQKTK